MTESTEVTTGRHKTPTGLRVPELVPGTIRPGENIRRVIAAEKHVRQLEIQPPNAHLSSVP